MSVSIFLFDSFAKVNEAWFASLYKVQETSNISRMFRKLVRKANVKLAVKVESVSIDCEHVYNLVH